VRIVIGSDHGGYALKQEVVAGLRRDGHDVLDVGTDSIEPVDYPDFAEAVGGAVIDGRAERGVLICGSGVGACVAANKLPSIRAAICHDSYSAHQGVEYDNVNISCSAGGSLVRPSLTISSAYASPRAIRPRNDTHPKVTALEQRYSMGLA
jgi:RpiB/LacA/LacB family sugar-phosphate isomerase